MKRLTSMSVDASLLIAVKDLKINISQLYREFLEGLLQGRDTILKRIQIKENELSLLNKELEIYDQKKLLKDIEKPKFFKKEWEEWQIIPSSKEGAYKRYNNKFKENLSTEEVIKLVEDFNVIQK